MPRKTPEEIEEFTQLLATKEIQYKQSRERFEKERETMETLRRDINKMRQVSFSLLTFLFFRHFSNRF